MTRAITSLVGFISKISKFDSDNSSEVFYRGHSDRLAYKIEPSVFRNARSRVQERNLLRELVSLHPGEFAQDTTTFDRLVRMQHFSLPTRLLDVTENPLIALYFACKGNPSKPAEVIRFKIKKSRGKYFDSDTVSCLANLAYLRELEKRQIKNAPDVDGLNALPAARRLLHHIKAEKSYFEPVIDPNHLRSVVFVRAKKSNRRILAQQGAFLLFGLVSELAEDNAFGFFIERIYIDKLHKAKILSDLDGISINDSTLFPEIDVAAKYIMSKLATP